MDVKLLLLVLSLLMTTPAFAKKLIIDYDGRSQDSHEEKSRSRRARASENREEDAATTRTPFKEAENGSDLRKIRRVAVGLQAAGGLGLGGVLLELNFTPSWGLVAGIGGGSGFQSTSFQAKYVLAGDWLMPYMTAGYTRWITTSKSGPIDKTTPSFLADKLLNDSERFNGEFHKNIIYPGFGLQFMTLKGEWAGASLYAELMMLLDVENFVSAPTGSLGFLYYF